MKTPTLVRLLCPLALLASTGLSAACLPVVGSVKLLPDASCQINLDQTRPSALAGQCYSVSLNLAGLPVGRGFAGVTSGVVSSDGISGLPTPAGVLHPGAPVPEQSIQTARSQITVGSGSLKTTLYTRDVIVAQLVWGPSGPTFGEAVTEQIIITGTDQKGLFAKATGYLSVAGNSIGRSAPVSGKICLP